LGTCRETSPDEPQPIRLVGGWWLMLICFERKVLLAVRWWLVYFERKVLSVGG
jgi:hypothetical protein